VPHGNGPHPRASAVPRTTGGGLAHTSGVHTGDAEERELFERLEREFAHVRAPRRRDLVRPPRRHGRMSRRHGRMPRRGDRTRRLVVGLLTTVVAVFAVLVVLRQEYGIRVTAGGFVGPERLRPEVVETTSGPFAYMDTFRGEPVTYSPCKPLSIVVNEELMPPEAAGLLEEAVERVVETTGLDIQIEGRTDEVPTTTRASRQSRYGERWAPVLVAWTTPQVEPALAGDVAGIGGSTSLDVSASGRPRYVTGVLSLDTPDLTSILRMPQGRALVRAVILHELGHVVGLGHVDDPRELMYAETSLITDFGPGDLAGLASLGRGGCV